MLTNSVQWHCLKGLLYLGCFLSGGVITAAVVVALFSAGFGLPEILIISTFTKFYSSLIFAYAANAWLRHLEDRLGGVAGSAVQPLAGHNWWVYHRQTQVSVGFRTGFFAADSVSSRSIANDLARLGHEVHHATDRYAVLDSILDRPELWDLLVFDLDAAPNLETGIDDLLDFRKSCPKVPVLVVSSAALRNDFSRHRRAMADGTLCKPVTRTSLSEGLGMADPRFTDRSARRLYVV